MAAVRQGSARDGGGRSAGAVQSPARGETAAASPGVECSTRDNGEKRNVTVEQGHRRPMARINGVHYSAVHSHSPHVGVREKTEM